MRVHFWGVRGSIAAPGPQTVRYGGNTACVEVTLDDGTTVILDGGTGLRELGLDFAKHPRRWPVHLLVSHYHWDHIQGFPFFAPIYDKDARLILYPFRSDAGKVLRSLLDQMDGAHFPLSHENIPARIETAELKGEETRLGKSAVVRRLPTNHPGGGWAFQIRDGAHQFVYMTDNEIDAPKVVTSREKMVEFCRGSDLVVLDAQYTPKDLSTRKGWGHSSTLQTVDLALESGCKYLVMFHHDPQRTDEELDALASEAQTLAFERKSNLQCLAASEGLEVNINSKGIQTKR